MLAAALGLQGGVVLAQPAAGPVEPLRLRSTPLLSETVPDGRATFVSGDRIRGRAGLETVIEGEAQLRRPGLSVRADSITYDETSDVVTARGKVRIGSQGDRYTATEGQLQVDAFAGFMLRPTYHFLFNDSHGEAERIDFHDEDHATVVAGTYTTCPRPGPDWVPDWLLRANQLDIDQEEDVGRAQGAVLEFKGVPIVPVPAVSFPLSGKRKSGLLPATVGLDSKSGVVLTLPWYWNIAPNRDATLTPTLMSRRGLDMAGQFRYLEDNYRGEINANLMPDDRLRDRTRWGLATRHSGVYDSGLPGIGQFGLSLDLNRVSDHDYWRDFSGHDGFRLVDRLLASNGALTWRRGDFSARVRAQKWQILQDLDAPIVPPYDRLPQITGRWAKLNDRGLDYSVELDHTRFRVDQALRPRPNGQRSLVRAEISRPVLQSWGFLTPRLALHASHYALDRPMADGRTSAGRVVPTLSLDSGLVFERPASYFGRAFTQTLEPRLKYVYTPYRAQNTLPNFDSGAYDFNFATIWSENAFAGDDRIVDNNLVTAGLTSRLLDPATGAEALRLAVAQRYRFAPQRVVLPGGQAMDRGWSDVMLGAAINWDPRWSFSTVLQYNPDTRKSTRTTIHGRWSPGPYRTINLAWRHQNDLKSEHLDVGWQWPLADLLGRRSELGTTGRGGGSCQGRWYSAGRLNYSLRDNRLVDSVVGLEYDAGCWIGRIVFEKLQSSVTSSTKRVLFQLEFVGLSRLGSNALSSLRDNVPHYRALREELTPPSRFTEYE